MFKIQANPRMVTWHLKQLQKYGFISKNSNEYKITDLGELLMQVNINKMVQFVEKAADQLE